MLVASSELAVRLDAADQSAQSETLAPLKDGVAPQTHEEMWAGFDPRAEPLEVEILKEWEEDGVELRVVRFRIGVFKGTQAMLAAVYGFPKGETNLPGLLQIHGGGQYADYKACLANAKRGYATVSISWAGRISAPDYRVSPAEVQLFWDGKTDDPDYRMTTDWGAVDGYHAPGRNTGNQFPSAKAATWTLDAIESPRNSGWFLCTLAARRALTFLEQQAEVDANRLGVYGHSMGGKLTVAVAGADQRVRAAAPSCGGISDRYNESAVFRATLGDDISLKRISCPIIFLSPSNDFHGRLGDLPSAVREIASPDWRVTCSPHHNHQDTPPYEVATLLWFDQHLKETLVIPKTPETSLVLRTDDGVPTLTVRPDRSKPVTGVHVFYTQHGVETQPEDRENAKHRFWHHAVATQSNGVWTAKLPLGSSDKPLWVYANVTYPLDEPVTGAGYYYRTYTAETFNVSSVVTLVPAAELRAVGAIQALEPSLMIESFEGDWETEWFTYRPEDWGRTTYKLNDQRWKAPPNAKLSLDVKSAEPNKIVVRLDGYVTEQALAGGNQWQTLVLNASDFHEFSGDSLADWNSVLSLTLSPSERLRPSRGESGNSQLFGGNWNGTPPRFRNLRWLPDDDVPHK
ncbi:acetylxylan esterase [Thalassoglobus sp. JC818]|uniref:dienelactone hydrolase family protein n=1 Tax=Thalassoglobus sp. JC818 TaxID=3232136 RepID=UPI0034586072